MEKKIPQTVPIRSTDVAKLRLLKVNLPSHIVFVQIVFVGLFVRQSVPKKRKKAHFLTVDKVLEKKTVKNESARIKRERQADKNNREFLFPQLECRFESF